MKIKNNIIILGVLSVALACLVNSRAVGQVVTTTHGGSYSTIQAAIDNLNTAAGDTLQISAGKFTENVTVSKSIYLWGQGATTIISPSTGTGIYITSNTVTIQNLNVSNTQGPGILAKPGISSLKLTSVACYGDSVGANLSSINGLNVNGCVFSHNQDHGFFASTVTNVVITSTTANGNGTSGAGSGFKLRSLIGTSTLTNLTADSNKTHGIEIGGSSQNVTLSGGEFKYNGTTQYSDGGGIYVYARSSTVSNITLNGPLTASNNITAGIYVDANTTSQDSIKGLSVGQSGGSITLTSNGSSRGTGILLWGNISNAMITANFSQGNVSTSAGIVIVGRTFTGADSPTGITIRNSQFNAGYSSSAPAIALADAQPSPNYIDVNGVTATGNAWPVGTIPDNLIYDHADNSNCGTVTHSGDILPVELVTFYTQVKRSDVTLVWSTATEVNSYGFEIQRLAVGNQQLAANNPQSAISNQQLQITQWTSVGFIPAAGTSSSPRSYSFTDASVPDGEYSYWLKKIDKDGSFTFSNQSYVVIGSPVTTPSLSQNFPNPFNPTTSIEFAMPMTEKIRVSVYNILGQRIAVLFDDVAHVGTRYRLQFDATGIPSGLYFYRLESGSTRLTKRMLLLK